ncbi:MULTISPECIES: hypothetical protein [unclassified Aureispira]|uniref:hypothetical protein n=1 Tax=unclassified Aureispira TaxID=2649989 RepID=UPI000697150F|nr:MULTISPECIES: hypothetical protein [unclassified Aureispira]WMX15032.1 hypothetical protein QP953_01455 [Aureispira sp. CCB-E]
MEKNKIDKELKDLSPFLSELKKDKKEGFSMPANYFDKFEDRLMHRIEEEQAIEGKQQSPKRLAFSFWEGIKRFFKPHYAIGFSTCALLIIGSIYVLQPVETATKSDVMEGLLADGSIDSYIYNHIEDFKTEDIVALLDVEEVADIQQDMVKEKLTVSNELSTEEKAVETVKSSMDKALEQVEVENLLEDITEEDLELNDDDLF